MTADELIKDTQARMDKCAQAFKQDIQNLRTGRASVKMLEDLPVRAYGSTMTLKELGTINVPEPQLLVVQPWDKSVITDIEKAIRSSELNLSPVTEGGVIRVPVPSLSQERRKELVKLLGKKAEEARVAVRNVRREQNAQLADMKKSGEITEDLEKRYQGQIQKQTDGSIKQIDDLAGQKAKELETV